VTGLSTILMSLVVAWGLDPWGQRELDGQVRSILSDEAYGFCHDAEYPLLRSEEDWCELRKDAVGRCNWEPACNARRGALRGEPGRLSMRRRIEDDAEDNGGEVHRGDGRGPARRPRRAEEDRKEAEIPGMGGLSQILFWLIIAGTVLFVLRAILKNLADDKTEEAESDATVGVVDEEAEHDAAARRAMETDVDRLLAYAQDAAARGDYEEAVDFSHAALLRRLDHEGLISLHRSRTNGDYVRDLRGHPHWRTPVRDALRHVDRAQFGNERPSRAMFDTIFGKVREIVKKAGPMAIWLFIATTLGCDKDPAKSYPWEYSPSGTRAVMDLLEQRDWETGFHTGSLTSLPDAGPSSVVVMLEGASVTEPEWEHLENWVRGGGVLIVASGENPPWQEGVVPVLTVPNSPPRPVTLHPDHYEVYGTSMLFLPERAALEVAESARVGALLQRSDEIYATVQDLGQGWTITVAGDELFSNASMSLGDNAAFVVDLLELSSYRRVRFVDSWASAGSDNPFESVRKSHLTPAVLQLLLLLAALFAWRGIRFGKGRDPAGVSRLAFTRHARAMAQHYRKAKAIDHAAKLYAAWALERLRDRFPTAARGGLSGLAQAVAARSGRDETEVMRLLVEAHSASGTAAAAAGEADGAESKRLIRELGTIMRDVGGTK
jgi:hypothetical protein